MRATLRGYDVIGRTGGEEFAFILPGAPAAEAAEVGERLRGPSRSCSCLQAKGPPASPFPSASPSLRGQTGNLISYYGLADAALYAAKQHGRDAVWIVEAGPEADGEPRPSGSVRVRAAS